MREMRENNPAKIGEESGGDSGSVCPDVVMKNNDSGWEKPWMFVFTCLTKVVQSLNVPLFGHCVTFLPVSVQIFGVNNTLMVPKSGTHELLLWFLQFYFFWSQFICLFSYYCFLLLMYYVMYPHVVAGNGTSDYRRVIVVVREKSERNCETLCVRCSLVGKRATHRVHAFQELASVTTQWIDLQEISISVGLPVVHKFRLMLRVDHLWECVTLHSLFPRLSLPSVIPLFLCHAHWRVFHHKSGVPIRRQYAMALHHHHTPYIVGNEFQLH